jgi:hypothetical protein
VAGLAYSDLIRNTKSWNFSLVLTARAAKYFSTVPAVMLSFIYCKSHAAVGAPYDTLVLYPVVHHAYMNEENMKVKKLMDLKAINLTFSWLA